MQIKEIAFVSYAVNDVGKARDFYENILGLKPASVFEKENMAFIEYEIGSSTLSIGKGAQDFKPGKTGGVVAFEVDDFDKMIQKLKNSNVVFVMDTQETRVCFMALIEDSEGNRIMIHKKK
jgi:predicted enzyme related to lactoylglutathione lyase